VRGSSAKYLVNPGTVSAPGRHSSGGLTFARPYLVSGNSFFVFPVGAEGFRRSGSATLGLHRYLGANTVDGVTVHFEEARIEMTGTFPGRESTGQMIACLQLLRSKPVAGYCVLYLPGIFEHEQRVLPENWDFSHDPDDRTHSINYTISFVRVGEGDKVSPGNSRQSPPEPSARAVSKPRGKPSRIYTVTQNVRTLRAISNQVYGNQSNWQRLIDLNSDQLNDWKQNHPNIPSYQIPTYRWPLGTQFRY
jgi:hypothetical protein